jgi:hypothetical protein
LFTSCSYATERAVSLRIVQMPFSRSDRKAQAKGNSTNAGLSDATSNGLS